MHTLRWDRGAKRVLPSAGQAGEIVDELLAGRITRDKLAAPPRPEAVSAAIEAGSKPTLLQCYRSRNLLCLHTLLTASPGVASDTRRVTRHSSPMWIRSRGRSLAPLRRRKPCLGGTASAGESKHLSLGPPAWAERFGAARESWHPHAWFVYVISLVNAAA